ncbi:sigma-70 family RNA polymerase sigma factor [Aeromicrobium sp. CTD01-1L150]|uniref:sigma-70 family RNA polymerase sigma factor n=1 Tax=Aeromicrobium sp. CTD01-1L150 TaxID=3341830 RepID=UPI0035C24B40
MATSTDALIHEHLPLAARLARPYTGRGVEREDLEQVARLALVKAARHYDQSRGAFAPFATATIRGELKRYFRDVAWDVRPPRRLQELQARISSERERNPRDADVRTIADHLDVDVAEVREAMAARGCFTCDSTDAAEEAGHPFPQVDSRLDAVEEWVTFCNLCGGLSRDERQLLHWRFVEELTQRQIGDRLGISQMQVSRRLTALLDRLKRQAHPEAA